MKKFVFRYKFQTGQLSNISSSVSANCDDPEVWQRFSCSKNNSSCRAVFVPLLSRFPSLGGLLPLPTPPLSPIHSLPFTEGSKLEIEIICICSYYLPFIWLSIIRYINLCQAERSCNQFRHRAAVTGDAWCMSVASSHTPPSLFPCRKRLISRRWKVYKICWRT